MTLENSNEDELTFDSFITAKEVRKELGVQIFEPEKKEDEDE